MLSNAIMTSLITASRLDDALDAPWFISMCLLKLSAFGSSVASKPLQLGLATLQKYPESLPDLVRILLQNGVDPNETIAFGQSLLHSTLSSTLFQQLRSHPEGHDILMRFLDALLEAGVDVTRLSNFGRTAAQYAWDYGHWEVWCEAVLANGLDIQEVDQSDPEGWCIARAWNISSSDNLSSDDSSADET